MTKKKKLFCKIIGALLMVISGFVACGLYWFSPVNDLGLSRSDLSAGSHPDVEALRTKATTVADAYLAQHDGDLKNICQGPYKLNVDYSSSRKIRSLDYRSSFYFYCWNIYLPYALHAQSGDVYTVVVQVSDATKDNKHDPDKFRVLRAVVIDASGSIAKMLE